ncbi:Cyclic di-GMP phosphodiesterase Gmr [Vibrio ruber DSM 16370]|uniref:Cyclic di-GMP phosphodiesterase Gmr n=1 Tax=Vibrio ruber (strain DSM 16370 / JCM 11486 / BCRC 17186 / CECT 7878 / LMG 23124 / VR1) TaxID=1123498 RepID=A0A1R4L901_VIBR1|nr:GGDEF domain-containing protein [Vibrio ruber]SJN52734.1 Cyclic di-GMP phosphodiesterase Gmr [Vibrio ruber DSM 16370]
MIVFSLWSLAKEQQQTRNNLESIMQIQLSIDSLRSQLWGFLQYEDADMLKQVSAAQQRLSEKLDQFAYSDRHTRNMIRMNENLSVLIAQESKYGQAAMRMEGKMSGRDLLHARYNMLVQNMTEDLLELQRKKLNQSRENQRLTLILAATNLLIFSAFVWVFALQIYRHFQSGFKALKHGFHELSQGKLSSQIETNHLDSEFVALADLFHQMKSALRKTMISRDDLQTEVHRQTEELKAQKERLLFLSEHDYLTGLLNRRAFEEHLECALIKARRSGLKVVVLFLDLDKFKHVNDNYGHEIGDELIRSIGERIHHHIRTADFAGRIGGDEFVICLNLLESVDCIEARIQRLSEEISQPISVNDIQISVGVSIGMSCFPDDAASKQGLLSHADQSMYEIKYEKRSEALNISDVV